MFNSERILHIAIVLTVSLSGLLLGLGQRDMTTTIIAIVGAIVAFLITEVFRLFRFDQWFANLAAILVTGYALAGFGGGDRVYQLIIVANLLVYLQTILLFQKKTPRLYWQILVLSLLHVVVAAVFNLGFEGGLLFIVYMVISGGTTMLLHLHQDAWNIRQRNEEINKKLSSRRTSESESKTIWFDPHPLAIYDQVNTDKTVLRRQMQHYWAFGFAAFVFAVLLFTIIPRDKEAWSGPKDTEVQNTGATKFVNLDFTGVIRLTSDNVMRVGFTDPETKENIQLSETPYFRGMPLSIISNKGDSTSWRAPYTRINEGSLDTPARGRSAFNSDYLVQTVVLEPTDDPLLYSASPYFRHRDTLSTVKFNTTLGCLTRDAEKVPNASFEYTLGVGISRATKSLDDWMPSGRYADEARRGINDIGFDECLDWNKEFGRYTKLVRKAEELSGRALKRDITTYEVAKNLEKHFLDPGNYVYTLDLGSFERAPGVDPVEDFVANHHSGHCEYFASALTLMLRSQGIPARLVVGYRGGDFNKFANDYRVQNKHAHAWVEAFIKPGDLPPGIANKSRHARRFGVWVRLDPTPASDLDSSDFLANASDAFGYARSFWNDYVLGMTGDGETALDSGWGGSQFGAISNLFNVETWRGRVDSFRDSLTDPTSIAYYLRFLIPGLMIWYGYWQWRKRRKMTDEQRRLRVKKSSIRQFLGRTLGMVSPKLGVWISGDEQEQVFEVPFYQRMSKLLKKYSFRREDSQTQLEFAGSVASTLEGSPHQQKIDHLLSQLTQQFYNVRFGGNALEADEEAVVQKSIDELETLLDAKMDGASDSPE